MNKLPLQVRLTLAFTLVMAAALAAIGFAIYSRSAHSLDSTIDASLKTRATEVSALVQQADNGLSQAHVGTWGAGVAQIIDRRDRLFDASPGSGRRPLVSAALLEHAPLFARAGGDRLFVAPVAAQGQRLFVVVGTSLTQRNTALAGLRRELLVYGPIALLLAALAGYGLASAALRPVERLRARERQFVADAAHELRTPLALLQAELELALDRPRTKQMLERALRSAAVEADRVALLAEDLLLLARLDQDALPLRTERLELGDLFAGVASRFERRARDADRALEYDGHGLTVRGDRLRLEQALSNLIENALRHGQGEIKLEAERHNGDVELHVRDKGGGIPPPFAPQAFDRFTRAQAGRTGAGAGLGLAIVLEIARAHGGTAGIRPQADIWLSLPAG